MEAMKTELNDRTLYGDGESVVGIPYLYDHLLNGRKASQVFVSKADFETDEVTSYNKKFYNDRVQCKESVKDLSFDWNIPNKYKELDLTEHLMAALRKECSELKLSDEDTKLRFYRLKMEYRVWKKRNLHDLLRTLIYVVNTFEEHNIVWGTGRGSSCASYILYLIGLHQVDSVEYDLDISEFFR